MNRLLLPVGVLCFSFCWLRPHPRSGVSHPIGLSAEIGDLAGAHGARGPGRRLRRHRARRSARPQSSARHKGTRPAGGGSKRVRVGACRFRQGAPRPSSDRKRARPLTARMAPFVVRSVTGDAPFVRPDDARWRGRLPSGVRLSPPAARRLTRFGIAPLLDPRLPARVRRRLLDLTGAVSPLPRGARHARGVLGGVPTTVAVAGGPGEHRVLYLHGGGYQVGSARAYRGLLTHLSRATGAPVHAPDYRLAPEHPYPAGAEDAHAAFRALRNAGHLAQRIAVAGDSAGGGPGHGVAPAAAGGGRGAARRRSG